jgi:hypothetical protein
MRRSAEAGNGGKTSSKYPVHGNKLVSYDTELPVYFFIPAYLGIFAIAFTGKIDQWPSRPRLQLHFPWPCQDLADRREVAITGIKDFSVLGAAITCSPGKSGGLNAVAREGTQGKTCSPSAEST